MYGSIAHCSIDRISGKMHSKLKSAAGSAATAFALLLLCGAAAIVTASSDGYDDYNYNYEDDEGRGISTCP